jgi:hypothetical protein
LASGEVLSLGGPGDKDVEPDCHRLIGLPRRLDTLAFPERDRDIAGLLLRKRIQA